MKKILSYIIVICSFAGLNSCSDFLDQTAEDMNTIEKVFASRTDTKKWFARLYATMNSGDGGYFMNELEKCMYDHVWMWATDDAAVYMDWATRKWYQGTVAPANYVNGASGYEQDPFYRMYQGIRHANLFLENVEKCTELSETEKRQMIAEAKFMRAMYHFWTLRCNGPIPIVEKSVAVSEAGALTPRNSMDECVDWLSQQFDDAAKDLLASRNDAELSFPTRKAALAIKSRLLLYAASPLYNGNTVYANWKNRDGKQLINQVYDKEKWKRAADAALAAIKAAEEQGAKLHQAEIKDGATDEEKFEAYVKARREVTTTWNDEVLWGRPQYGETYFYYMNSLPGVFFSWFGGNGVTLELINKYSMRDGSPAPDVQEWFAAPKFSTEDGFGTQANTFWMCVDREPRFYADTHFPNMRVSYATTAHPDKVETVEFWASGNSGYNNNDGNMNYTGFSTRKNIPVSMRSDREEGITETDTYANVFPVIRLGELYLNYAEALNEYYRGSNADILTYLNKIRNRAGLPSYTGTYTYEQLQTMIRDERRVELAWECHRFFDVRRWFIAHGPNGVFNTPVHGFNYTKGTSATDLDFFMYTKTQDRTFRLEHYFYPIAAAEVAYNTELVQAPFY